jgi:hypothetical protein
MATSSYANVLGTNGAGQQGSKAGIRTLYGQQATPETDEERQRKMAQQPAQTFAQLQKQGMARPAPQPPQGQPFARFEGSQQAQQARTGMLGALQQQLQQPTRFDTQAFQQIRQAQQANLQSQYEEQQRQLNEDLARRGLSASNIAASGLGRLGGAQARALADIDAQLLQQAAQTQAADRLAALQAAQGFAELAGSQDLAQFEANRVAQAAEFQQGLQGAQFGQQQREFERGQALAAAQAQQAGGQAAMELDLRRQLGLGELTGRVDGQQTLASQRFGQEQQQFKLQQAAQLSQITGQVYDIDASGNVAPKTINGQPVRTESALARLSQEQLARAEITGNLRVDGIDVPTLAAQRLDQEQLNALRDQALRQSQATGVMYKVNATGDGIEPETVNGQAITTEQRRAQQAQELAQTRQLAAQQAEALSQQTGLAYKVDDAGKVVADVDPATRQQRTTVQAQQLKQQLDLQLRQLDQQRELQLAELGGEVSTPVIDPATGEQRKDAQGRPVFQSRETVQSRQLRQQYENQQAELSGFVTIPDPTDPTKKVRVSTVAARQLDQQRVRDLAAQAIERSQLTGFAYEVNDKGEIVQQYGKDEKPIQTLTAREAQEERNLRTTMQTRELTSQEKRTLDELTVRREQLAQQAAEAAGRVQVGTRIVTQLDGRQVEEPIFESTVQQQQLEQQRKIQEAELTGEFTRPDGTKVSTLASQQLGQQRAAQLADQAARQSQLTGVMYKVDSKGNIVQERGPDNQPISTEARRAQMQQEEQARLDRQLRETLGMGELTGTITRDGQVVTTLPAQTARQNLLVQLAGALAGSEQGIPANFLQQLYAALGIYNPPGGEDNTDERRDRATEGKRGATSGTPSGGTGTGTGTGAGKGTGTK